MSIIRFKETLVNKEIMSKETRLKSSGMCKSIRFFMRSKLLFDWTESVSLRIRFYIEMKLN